jgi:hypothetical protein
LKNGQKKFKIRLGNCNWRAEMWHKYSFILKTAYFWKF